MLRYILLGASVGTVIGHLIPPGSLFWFVIGAVGGYGVSRYTDHRWY